MEQQREPEVTQQHPATKESALYEPAPTQTVGSAQAGSAQPFGEAPGYGLSDPRSLPQDAPTRGGNLPGETAGSRVPEQQQYEQREQQQQQVLPVHPAQQQQEQQQHVLPVQREQQEVLPVQREQPVVQQQQPVVQQQQPVAQQQQPLQQREEVDEASDDESSSTTETEPVTHLQRDNAQAIKTKLTEMDNGQLQLLL
jgi:hypothetical protein